MNKTVERIINLINSKGIEQKTFAEAIGVKSNAISEWKSGRTKSYIKYIDKIADYLNVSADYLLGRIDSKNEYSNNLDNLEFEENIQVPTCTNEMEKEMTKEFKKLTFNNKVKVINLITELNKK